MVYEFQGQDAAGASVKGTIQAPDHPRALQLLRTRGLRVSSLRPAKEAAPAKTPSLDYRKLGPAALALTLLLLGARLFSSRSAPSVSASAVPTGVNITLAGLMPGRPVEKVHLTFPEIPLQIDKMAGELGKPGEAFEILLELPARVTQLAVEVNNGHKSWQLPRVAVRAGQTVRLPSLAEPPVTRQLGERLYPAPTIRPRVVAHAAPRLAAGREQELLRRVQLAPADTGSRP